MPGRNELFELKFWYPKKYPSLNPPCIDSPNLTKKQMIVLQNELQQMWNKEKSVIMHTFITWLNDVGFSLLGVDYQLNKYQI